ncbi:MAG TPA: hypothetical protein VGH65_02850 [Verrucomicrobiaceae bacterium]
MTGGEEDVPRNSKPAADGDDAKGDASTKGRTKLQGADPSSAVEETTQGLGAFGKLLPLGQKNRDVKIPSFRDGNPSSFIRAATMTRLDGEKMDMERLDIRMYGPTEDRDLRIMLPTATYHMETEVLSSEDRSRISRTDFDLQGDTLIFDTRTQQGKMTGHIHMIIHDAESFRQKPADPAAASAAGGADQPKTEAKAPPPSEKK